MIVNNPQAPQGIWETLWPIIAPVLTPELVGGWALVVALSQFIKQYTALLRPELSETATRWKSYRSAVSVSCGAMVGLCVWYLTDMGVMVVIALAFGSGPVWALMIGLLPQRMGWALMTDPDRKWHTPPGSRPEH